MEIEEVEFKLTRKPKTTDPVLYKREFSDRDGATVRLVYIVRDSTEEVESIQYRTL